MALGDQLTELGKDVTFVLYPGTGHAFGNEENALGTHDAEATAQAWARSLDFLHSTLG
jgi:dienelactone hydrolase